MAGETTVICSQCEKPAKAAGLCWGHYQWERRYRQMLLRVAQKIGWPVDEVEVAYGSLAPHVQQWVRQVVTPRKE